MFLFGIDTHLCVYMNMCGNRETDSVQFGGPESGVRQEVLERQCNELCWRREGSGNKTERHIEREGGRENETSIDTKRNRESHSKGKRERLLKLIQP